MEACQALMTMCSTRWAPWTIVPADREWHRDLVVGETIVEALEDLELKYPPAAFDRSKVVVE